MAAATLCIFETGMTKLLLVDDDTELAQMLQEYLEREDFAVTLAHDGETGATAALSGEYALAVLDVMMPRASGMDALARIRAQSDLPVIMLTAKGDDIDRIIGLEMGADDYITKPFSPREVLARIKALHRRLEKPQPKEVKWSYGGISLDGGRHDVTYKGRTSALTSKEFKLLEYFLANRGRVLSRDILLNELWGYDYFGTTRTVDVHVARLRQKFPVLEKSLISIKGLGYKLSEDPPKS